MSEAKTLRLSKVAKELNVGISTIAEFLSAKGHVTEANPNTKIDEAQHALVLKQFASDQQVKEKSRQMGTVSLPKGSVTIEDKLREEKKERFDELPSEVLIKDTSLKSETAVKKPVVEEKQEEVAPVVPKVETPAPSIPEEAPEAPAPPPVEIPPMVVVPEIPAVKEEPPVEKPAEEPQQKAPAEDNAPGLRVLGKIDLEDRKKKPAPKPKAPEPEVKPKAEEKPATPVVEKPAPVAEKPASTPVTPAPPAAPVATTPTPPAEPETPKAPPARQEPEMIRGTVEKLEGPTILGKIVLPVDGNRRGGSSQSAADAKKKRKRIQTPPVQKVNPGAPGQNQGQGQGQRTGGPGGQNRPGGGPNRPGGGPNRPGGGPGGQNRPGGGPNRPGGGPNRGRTPEPKVELTEEQIQKQIKETLARLSERGKGRHVKLRREKRAEFRERQQEEAAEIERDNRILKVTEFVSASQLSQMMEVPVTDIISACMSLGLFVSINQRLDAETISIIAEEFGFDVRFVTADIQEAIAEQEDREEDRISRPPVVTVMGHVDHGKTSLLDYVRKANVIAGEAGGITQHIGAYGVQLEDGRLITFIDTPGHEAFTAMRARGAQITDVAIIVIAADDSVMPQTIEAINHARAANVPMVFAINKIDKPGANPDKIREALAQMNILVEEWGGKFQCQEISAKQGLNIDKLLEKVLLEAEMLELKANPKLRATGVVIEAQLDKGRGYVCTLLVQNGTLGQSDVVLAGPYSGRVKALFNERGSKADEAGPSMPVRMLGLSGAPQAGDRFNVMEDEREAREIATKRQQLQREQGIRAKKHITLDEIGRRIAIGDFKQLNIIIKGDTDGSIEALTDALLKLSTENIQVNVIHKSVGAISESDVLLASASDAIIVGFQVRPNTSARKLAEKEEIDIRHYSVIYQAIDEVKAAMEGMLAPEVEEKVTANVEIREVFVITKVGAVAGCYVLDGKIARNHKIRIIRDGIVVHTGKLSSLKRFKDDVKEVATGYECGLTVDRFDAIKVGDIIEAYEEVEVKRKL